MHNIKVGDYPSANLRIDEMQLWFQIPCRTIGLSREKDLFYVFADGEVVTVFNQGIKYFKRNAELSSMESVIKTERGDRDENI